MVDVPGHSATQGPGGPEGPGSPEGPGGPEGPDGPEGPGGPGHGPGWQDVAEALAYGTTLLVGTAVRLRAPTDADLAVLDHWWNDPRVAVFNARQVMPRTPGAHHDRIRGWSPNEPDGNAVGFAVETLPSHDGPGGEFVGHVNLFAMQRKERSATFGIVLGPDFWSRGLGSEATALMVRYGFVELGLHRIQLTVFAYNERAVKAYAKAGFQVEGRHREVVHHGGRWHDELTMSVLEDEWRAKVAGRPA